MSQAFIQCVKVIRMFWSR